VETANSQRQRLTEDCGRRTKEEEVEVQLVVVAGKAVMTKATMTAMKMV
jgi:hypothetical protein